MKIVIMTRSIGMYSTLYNFKESRNGVCSMLTSYCIKVLKEDSI